MVEVKDILEKNGFEDIDDGQFIKGKVIITIFEDNYTVEHWDEEFLEWLVWYSEDLNIYTLLGYLSFYNFIPRGYEK